MGKNIHQRGQLPKAGEQLFRATQKSRLYTLTRNNSLCPDSGKMKFAK